jgi:hypothetical protein
MLGTPEENSPCHHCGAEPGERHRDWDDIARCAVTGQQLISCKGGNEFLHEISGKPGPYIHDHECKPDIWDGEWPGVKACREFGWFTDPNSEFKGREDLNRLTLGAIWNPETEKYEKR